MNLLAELRTMVETKELAGTGFLNLDDHNDRSLVRIDYSLTKPHKDKHVGLDLSSLLFLRAKIGVYQAKSTL